MKPGKIFGSLHARHCKTGKFNNSANNRWWQNSLPEKQQFQQTERRQYQLAADSES